MTFKRGFTLTEMLAVTVVLAITAGAVVVRHSSLEGHAAFQHAARRWSMYDRQTRQMAIGTGRPLLLEFDLTGRTVRRLDAKHRTEMGHAFEWTPAVTAEEVKRGRTGSDEGAYVYFGPQGGANSYAIRLSGRTAEAGGQWMFLAGMTGQVHLASSSDHEVQELLDADASHGDDLD